MFTFILEFRGGTHISQYRGRTAREALRSWSRREAIALQGQWRRTVVDRLFEELLEQRPAPVGHLSGVWCVDASVDHSLALLNIVRTSQTGD
jgi:hypothetical protein